MLGIGGFVGVIKGEISFLHALVKVTGFAADQCDEVLLGFIRNGDGDTRFGFIMDDGGAFSHGLIDGENGGEQFVLNLDLFQRGFGLFRRFSGDGSDAVADMTNLGVKDEGVIGRGFGVALAGGAVDVAGHVAMPEDDFHPGHFFGLGDIDGRDAGMGVGAPQHLDDQGIAGGQIADVRIFTEGQLLGIDFGDRVVDLFEVGSGIFAHGNAPGLGVQDSGFWGKIIGSGFRTWGFWLPGGPGHDAARPRFSRSQCSGRDCRPYIRGRFHRRTASRFP